MRLLQLSWAPALIGRSAPRLGDTVIIPGKTSFPMA
jgi:hypothetical protein